MLTSAAAAAVGVVGAGGGGREPRGALLEAASAGRYCFFGLGWSICEGEGEDGCTACFCFTGTVRGITYNTGVNIIIMQAMAETRNAVAWRVLGHPRHDRAANKPRRTRPFCRSPKRPSQFLTSPSGGGGSQMACVLSR
jgi:hypothetical protein